MNKTFPTTIKLSLTYSVKSHAALSDGCWLETPALSLLWVSKEEGREGWERGRGRVHYLFSLLNNVTSPRPPHHHLWTFSHGSAAGKSDNWLDYCTVRETLFFSYLIRDTRTARFEISISCLILATLTFTDILLTEYILFYTQGQGLCLYLIFLAHVMDSSDR